MSNDARHRDVPRAKTVPVPVPAGPPAAQAASPLRGRYPMSSMFPCRMRPHALAGAAALVLSCLATPAFAGRADLSGLQSADSFDQFIVNYREGAPGRTDPAARARSLDAVARSMVAGSRALRSGAQPGGLRIAHQRRLAMQADVIRVSRALDRVDAETLMRQLAADPDVEYVEVDKLNRTWLTPNDPRYPAQWHYHEATGGLNLPAAWDRS